MKLCLLLFLLGLFCPGLTQDPSPGPPDGEEVQSCGAGFSAEDHRAMGGAIERLGLRLLEKLPISPQQPNVILSPLSVALALAQLALGSRHETEKLLLENLNSVKLSCYHHVLGELVSTFRNTSLEVATRMYLKPGFEVKLSFVEESVDRYQSYPVPLVSVEEVNQWVENATKGHISNLLDTIPNNVVLMLLNAVFFKGEWQTQFDPSVTSKGMFYLEDQKSVMVDMMNCVQYPLRLLVDRDLEAQVASFPFRGNTSFLVVQPLAGRGNVSAVLPKLNISDLYSRLPQEKTMQVSVPKVKLQYRQQLQEVLTSMGLGSLFSSPDLSGISDEPLRVSEVYHASTIELSEEGAEATGATVVTATRSMSYFSLNSPFVFALVDDSSLTPLFMGVVTNPAPDSPAHNRTMSDQPAAETTGTPVSDSDTCKTESCSVNGLDGTDGKRK